MKKVTNIAKLDGTLSELRETGEKIILTGGSFDILHAGHIDFLEKSKNIGGKLIVLLESDESIKKLKGGNRPLNNQVERAIIISHLNMVDLVVLLPFFEDKDYEELVKKIKPDIIAVVKTDSKKEKKQRQAKMIGAKLIEVMEKKEDYSTSNILSKLNIE